MLKYLSNKSADGGPGTKSGSSAPAKPRYKGPDPQKNRLVNPIFRLQRCNFMALV